MRDPSKMPRILSPRSLDSANGFAAFKIALLAVIATLAATAAIAQPQSSYLAPVSAPDQSNAIPLYAPGAHAETTEQWVKMGNFREIHNVTVPTLTPFLPDPANATGAAVIVAPGGGFVELSIDSEGYDVAHWLASHGVAAFVLKYRLRATPQDPQGFAAASAAMIRNLGPNGPDLSMVPMDALDDAKAAVRLVRARAQDWHVDPNRLGFVGFSAGAMLTESLGITDDTTARPNFIAPIYGPMNDLAVPADAPPMFVALALDDPLMAGGKNLGLLISWWKAGRPVEAHFYGRGGHGFGMAQKSTAAALWIDEFYAWMSDRRLLKPLSVASAGTTSGSQEAFSTDTPIGMLLDDPKAHAMLQALIPTIVNSNSITMARSMSLRQLQAYASAVLTDNMLSRIDLELAKLNAAPSHP